MYQSSALTYLQMPMKTIPAPKVRENESRWTGTPSGFLLSIYKLIYTNFRPVLITMCRFVRLDFAVLVFVQILGAVEGKMGDFL